MRQAQRFACISCGDSKFLPENPRTGKRTVRTGCEDCASIVTHHAVGRAGR